MRKQTAAQKGAAWLHEFVASQATNRKRAARVRRRDDLIRGVPKVTSIRSAVATSHGYAAFAITERADGGPVRPISRGAGGKRLTGLAYSRKSGGKLLGWESRNELHAFHRFEVLTSVASYREQPHTLKAVVGERPFKYTPDVECRLADGSVQVVEVKDDFELQSDPDYIFKLEIAAEAYAKLGWRFDMLERSQIEHPIEFKAIEEIYAYATLGFRADQLHVVRNSLATRGASTIAELVTALGGEHRQILYPMMIERHIAIDFTRPLGPKSRVTLYRSQEGK